MLQPVFNMDKYAVDQISARGGSSYLNLISMIVCCIFFVICCVLLKGKSLCKMLQRTPTLSVAHSLTLFRERERDGEIDREERESGGVGGEERVTVRE